MQDQANESQTQRAITEMTMYGKRPFSDEIDHRPLPDAESLRDAACNAFDIINHMFVDTRLEEDTQGILWGFVNLFHRKVNAVEKQLDKNEYAQQRSQREQDGSEIKDVELQDLITEGQTMLEQRDVFELLREEAGEYFEVKTGNVWRPAAGSMVNHNTMTAATIDSIDYIKAKRTKETEILIPQGTLIAFSGGMTYQDHTKIWQVLDTVKARHNDMVLIHGGATKGAELIAAKWASNRGVATVVFKPDWKTHGKAAPFKRNDKMLEQMPAGAIVFPGTGINENFADKARMMGIKVHRPVKE